MDQRKVSSGEHLTNIAAHACHHGQGVLPLHYVIGSELHCFSMVFKQSVYVLHQLIEAARKILPRREAALSHRHGQHVLGIDFLQLG